MRRRWWAPFSLLVITTGLTVLPGEAAGAHAVLVLTVPAAAARLDSPPDQVAVQFSDPVLELGAQLRVSVADQVLLQGPASVQGATISHPLGGDLPAGLYQVLWRATSVDGHVVSGAYDFTVVTGAARPPVTGSTGDRPAGTGSTGSSGSSGSSGGGKLQWVFAVLAAAGAGLAVISSRRRLRAITGE